MGIERKWSIELRLAYAAVLLFIVAQRVVNERPWDHIFRIAGTLAFVVSMFLALHKQRRGL